MSTHNIFSWRNKENIVTFRLKSAPYLELCQYSLNLFWYKKQIILVIWSKIVSLAGGHDMISDHTL